MGAKRKGELGYNAHMPELPEVETTRLGLEPHLAGRHITQVIVRCTRLRWPIPEHIEQTLTGQPVCGISRRAKYLLLHTPVGSALLHLGMSGHLRIVPSNTPLRAHDHVDIGLDNGQCVRFNDPRRFGCVLWQAAGQVHPLLSTLGVEPLDEAFNADYLYQRSRKRNASIKAFLMDQRIVTGIGNIYAAESLFLAEIHPLRAASSLTHERYQALVNAIKTILISAIARGGTTLRDFSHPDGTPGYFMQELWVYGRQGRNCFRCGNKLHHTRTYQRSVVWCGHCQK